MLLRNSGLSVAASLLLLAPFLVSAYCECGYSVNATTDPNYAVYTDLLESDFTTVKNISLDTDWVVQEWQVDPAASNGPYGRQTQIKNVVSNPVKNANVSSAGIDGDEAGLELYVRSVQPGDQYIGVAEVDSDRMDMLYGTFRAGIKMTSVNGTCGAFFWYFNDTQEIDMEFLSSQLNGTTSPVNLVLHSILSEEQGGDASHTPTYKVIPLPFAADDAVHEYRYDWEPGQVTFYADGEQLVVMTEQQYVPSVPGKVILSHWSNGNPLWSGGPPAVDAKMVVSYVKAYFNSSEVQRRNDYTNRCHDPLANNSICQIPDQIGAPVFGQVPFFSKAAGGNMTVNQTVYGYGTDKKKTSAGISFMKVNGLGGSVVIAAIVGGAIGWVL
ncbi:hypothetical protein RUND412_003061 [Rhizina undulata]